MLNNRFFLLLFKVFVFINGFKGGSTDLSNEELDKWLNSMSDSKLKNLLNAFDNPTTTLTSTTTPKSRYRSTVFKDRNCYSNHMENKIVDVRESIHNGAKMLMEKKFIETLQECESACCATNTCDMVVFRQVPDDEDKKHCYLFYCSDKCQFSADNNFLISFVSTKRLNSLSVSATMPTTTKDHSDFENALKTHAEQSNVDVCLLSVDRGHCFGEFSMWYYDSNDHACKEFTYTGCRGNKNKFDTKEDCEVKCKMAVVTQTATSEDPKLKEVKPYSTCKANDDCSYPKGACINHHCLCADGFHLVANSCHKKCSSSKEFSCLHAGQVEGRYVSCVSLQQRCDGTKNCADGSDELGCRQDVAERKPVQTITPEVDTEISVGAKNTTLSGRPLGATASHGAGGSRRANQSMGAVVALSLALGLTFVMLLFVGCKLRTVKSRIRKGRPKSGNEADYLINGMYL